MIDTDYLGVPYSLGALDAQRVLELAGESVPQRRRAELRPVRLASRWAELHPAAPGDGARWSELTGEWRLVADAELAALGAADRVGGVGCPEVSVKAITELGTAMGLSRTSAAHLMQDALDLAFRLPKIWARCNTLEVDVWKARLVARLTHLLSAEAAAWVDAELERRIGKVGAKTIEMAVAMAIATFHPDLVAEKARRGKAGWHVRVHHPEVVDFAATSTLEASADSLDLEDLLAAASQVAAELAAEGDTDPFQQRLAKALGTIGRWITGRDEHPWPTAEPNHDEHPEHPSAEHGSADDEACTDLTAPVGDHEPSAQPRDDDVPVAHDEVIPDWAAAESQATADYVPPVPPEPVQPEPAAAHSEPRPAPAPAGQPASAEKPRPRPARGRPRKPIIVFAHLTPHPHDPNGAPTALYEVPRFGVVGDEVFDRWAQARGTKIHRVVDLNRSDAVDRHDPPEWMRTQVQVRDRHCVFPGCTIPAEGCDLDHIVAYDDTGPPGQTNPKNLACLCRGHHLLKTFAGWTYQRARDGTYVWTSPMGQVYFVTSDGTTHFTGTAA